jgi:VWFA-related protein
MSLLPVIATFAQQQPQTFRAASHLIVQSVSVKDKQGKPVEGLTAKDFVLTEDGVPQDIAFVEYERVNDDLVPQLTTPTPLEPPAVATVPPVVGSSGISIAIPAPGEAKYRDRRLLVLYIDLSRMPFFDKFRVFESAETYIRKNMTVADLVAIMSYDNGRAILRQDFTDDRAKLLGVLAALTQAAEDKESGVAFSVEPGGAFGEDDATFNMFETDRQLAALQTTVTSLAPLPEVKTLIYMGSGLQLSGADNMAQLRATVNAAVRANVTINPIDTRGLVASPPLGDATRASRGGVGMFNGAIAQASIGRQQQSQDTYYALAKDTGGRAMFDNNNLSMGISQAARAVSGYYLLGYYTKNPAPDGKYRRVKVALAAGVEAELAYRAGYYADKVYAKFNAADKERQLEDALRLEDPITDIPMAMELNYFQISSAEYFVPISVRMPGSELARLRPAGDARAEIDVIGEIKDEYGVTLRNMRDKVEFSLNAATAGVVARRAIQYETGFTLLPGNYTIKMLARDATSGRIGTFQTSFAVPNLDRERVRLPISTVVVTSQRVPTSEALYTVKQKIPFTLANPLVTDGLKLVPNVTRTFSAGQPVFVFLQAYQRDAVDMRPLVAFVTFYRDGATAFETEMQDIADGWDPKTRAVPIRFTIAPGSLSAGAYDCQVTVLDPAGNRAAFWRTAVTIVP